MKVFISWSGTKSHKVGILFRDWLPSVIQSIKPYVSSEDIDKGARWSSDIANELEDSSFGILCVTKENLHAPWLSFEAGALSKTMDKTFVTPFLFDIKRIEVNGPILQFQSTIFDKDDIKKLLVTINKACKDCGETGITDEMLEKAFEIWYPNLEQSLNELNQSSDTPVEEGSNEIQDSEILEEILELSRDNQKLLRNPDNTTEKQINELVRLFDSSLMNRNMIAHEKNYSKKFQSMFMEEILHEIIPELNNDYSFLILLSFLKDDYPWIYNMGKELYDVVHSDVSDDIKQDTIRSFNKLIEFTFEHPAMREMNMRNDKYSKRYIREIPYILEKLCKNMFMY